MVEHLPTTAEPAASVDFEREKWRAEMALRERELALKEREGSLFKSPIVVSAIAVFVGLLSNAVSDWITKDRRLAEETRQREAALMEKAIENDDLDKVLRKLKLLDEANLIPDYDKVRKVYATLSTMAVLP